MSRKWYTQQDCDEQWIERQVRQYEEEKYLAEQEAMRLAVGAGIQLEFDFEYPNTPQGTPF